MLGFGSHFLAGNNLHKLADVIFVPLAFKGVHWRL